MTKDIKEIQDVLISLLREHLDVLKITADTSSNFEVSGTVETMQGKKKVEGIYFASVVPKPKDVRFYFFPIYTHKEAMGDLPENLQKALKGKSCFHIKYMDEALEGSIRDFVKKGVSVYKSEGLLRP